MFSAAWKKPSSGDKSEIISVTTVSVLWQFEKIELF